MPISKSDATTFTDGMSHLRRFVCICVNKKTFEDSRNSYSRHVKDQKARKTDREGNGSESIVVYGGVCELTCITGVRRVWLACGGGVCLPTREPFVHWLRRFREKHQISRRVVGFILQTTAACCVIYCAAALPSCSFYFCGLSHL